MELGFLDKLDVPADALEPASRIRSIGSTYINNNNNKKKKKSGLCIELHAGSWKEKSIPYCM